MPLKKRTMDSTYRDINRQAILSADSGELYRAQCLFRQNVNRHRCLTTLNNLAVFYAENNSVDRNARERDGKWLALHYFEQALALEPTDKTFFAAAAVHYNCGAFAAAADYFEMAFEQRNTAAAAFNCGVARYRMGEYAKATACFAKALPLCGKDTRADVLTAYAFAVVYAGSRLPASLAAEVESNADDYAKFFLAYASGDDVKAMQYLKGAEAHFSLSAHAYAVVTELFLRHGKAEQASTCVQQEIESLKAQSAYGDIRMLHRLLADSAYRNAQARAYRYPLFLMRQCCYMDCPTHG